MVQDVIEREAVACALCGSDDAALLHLIRGRKSQGVYENGVYRPVSGSDRIVRCRNCGLIYVNPRIVHYPNLSTYSDEEEAAYFHATRADRMVGNAALLGKLEGILCGPGNLLDVGCGDGLAMAQAQMRGWTSWGMEIRESLVTHIRKEYRFKQVFHGTLESAQHHADRFDAVLLINVIEHVRNPLETVGEVARVLRPGGLVAVHTPNARSLAAWRHGSAWRHYEPLEHFYYFDIRTLSALLKAHGLLVIDAFALPGASKAKRWLQSVSLSLGLRLDNGLGLVAQRPGQVTQRIRVSRPA